MQFGSIWGKCQEIPDYAIRKAGEELHETEEKRLAYPEKLRDVIKQRNNTEIGAKIEETFFSKDDDFLLRFIRARKFDIEKAYILMTGYVKFRQKYPELFEDLNKGSVTRTLEHGFPGLLPERDKLGRVVFLFNIGNWSAREFPFDDVMRGYVFLLEKLIENEETQINGFALIENFDQYSISQATSMRPSDLSKMVNILQGAFPARFKAIHFIREPWYFSWTYSLVRPFLRGKITKRIHVHGKRQEKFFSEFEETSIPEDFCGKGSKYDPLTLLSAIPGGETHSPNAAV